MSTASRTTGTLVASLLVCLLLGLGGCVHVDNPKMPADWPALHSLVRVSELEGTYRGDPRNMAGVNQVFFPGQLMTIQGLDRYRFTTMPAGLQVEALAGETILNTRVIPVELEAGAVMWERKHNGQEGLAAASYTDRAKVRVNAAGELVVELHRSSVGVVFPIPAGSSTTEWYRLPRATE